MTRALPLGQLVRRDDRTRPLRQALETYALLTIREADGDLPTAGEVALAIAGVRVAWAALGDVTATAVYRDERRQLERLTGRSFVSGEPASARWRNWKSVP